MFSICVCVWSTRSRCPISLSSSTCVFVELFNKPEFLCHTKWYWEPQLNYRDQTCSFTWFLFIFVVVFLDAYWSPVLSCAESHTYSHVLVSLCFGGIVVLPSDVSLTYILVVTARLSAFVQANIRIGLIANPGFGRHRDIPWRVFSSPFLLPVCRYAISCT